MIKVIIIMKNGSMAILFLCFSITLISSKKENENEPSFAPFSNVLRSNIKKIMGEVLMQKMTNETDVEKEQLKLSEQCKNSIKKAYVDVDPNDFYLKKLIDDSSYNKNDIGSFLPCMKRRPSDVDGKVTWNYLMATFNHIIDLNYTKPPPENKTKDDPKEQELPSSPPSSTFEDRNITINTSLYETKWKIMGLCVVPGCTEQEYSALIYFLDKHLDNFFEAHYISEVSTIVIESDKLSFQFEWWDILRFIPCLLILLQLLMSMFSCFPYVLFKSCFKNKALNGNNEEYNQQKSIDSMNANPFFDKKEYVKFTTTFSLSRNSEELFGTGDGTSTLHNDSGMSYLKGIIGINMLFLIFGAVFFVLHASPIAKINEVNFINLMRNFFFGVFFYGLRYAPKMLFSCSGFSLIYKMLCYLDDCSLIVTEKHAKTSKEIQEEEMKEKMNPINRQSKVSSALGGDEEEEEEREYNDIYFSNLFNFWKAQSHKYIIIILVTLFFKFSLYKLALIFVNKGATWEYFKRRVIDSPYSFDWPLIVSFIFGLHSFYVPDDCLEYFINYQWMVYNEIICFMISSFFIFIGYRYKIRVDIFFLSAMFAILIMKIIVTFISEEYHSSLYYYFFKFWNIVSIPFFNYFYYVIGIMFGAANYVIQKDISYKTARSEERYFLIPVIKILNILKKKGQAFIYIVGAGVAIVIVGLSILQAIILQFSSVDELLNNHMESYLSNQIRNTFLLFDTYIIVFLFHFSTFCFYLIGNNAINNFFSLKGWGILSKMYFSFILVVHPCILYFVYQSETQINFDISNILLYSLICAVFSLLISCLFYISFELPYKRLVRLILNRLNKEEDETDGLKKEFGEDILEESLEPLRKSDA